MSEANEVHSRDEPPVAAHRRVAELDALRGLAALAVVAFHYTTHYQNELGHVRPLGFGFPAGNYGVHLFFLISGFVIFMTLDRTRSAMDFVVSRFSRLFPAYWAAIAITAGVVYTIGMPQQRIPVADLVMDLTMIQDLFAFEQLDGSYWTLEVELFFYAQMLFWFVLGKLGRIHWIIASWLVLVAAYALTEQQHLHFSYYLRELLILRHIPYFALGILFYRMYTQPQEHGRNLVFIALSLLTIGVAYDWDFLVAALVCCAIFWLFMAGRLRWLDRPAFVFFGTISYSLYLLHQAIGFALIHRFEAAGVPSILAVATTVVVILLLATALTYGVEQPAMRGIRRWRRARQGQAQTQA